MSQVQNFLNSYFKYLDIKKGDHLLIHSDLRNLFRILFKEKIKLTPDEMIDFFVNLVGPNGSVSFPTFNFDFCNIGLYSFNNTISKMGILSEAARKNKYGNKTWNPVYSFKIFGNVPKKIIERKNYNSLGKDTFFDWLNINKGKIIIINLPDQKSMTIYHHFEELKLVDWRYHKKFKGIYIDKNEKKTDLEISIFVRKIDNNIVTDVSGMEKLLWKKKLYKSINSSNIDPRIINIQSIQKEVFNIIDKKKGEGTLYRVLK